MLNFCTLFNSFYLTRALAMHRSLMDTGATFHLFMFTFDQTSFDIVTKLELEHVTVIAEEQFLNEKLKEVKKERELHEYFWTCTPWTVGYVLDNFDVDHCTYIDADIYFFANPQPLVTEMKENSILITEHRYTKRYDQTKRSGIYCVQFVTFKNNTEGRTALQWWMERCLEWCYDRVEDGKFGDQKYLDDWPERFEGVHVLEHLGGGVAPWNVQQYDITLKNNETLVQTKVRSERLIFYHFHDIKFYDNDKVDLGVYKLAGSVKNNIYAPYLRRIVDIEELLQSQFGFDRKRQRYFYRNRLLTPAHRIVRIILNVYNIFSLHELKTQKWPG